MVDGPPMFKKTIAVGPLEPVESCATGGAAAAARPRRCPRKPAALNPNPTLYLACRGRAAKVLCSVIEIVALANGLLPHESENQAARSPGVSDCAVNV